jgi:hypothetical protein
MAGEQVDIADTIWRNLSNGLSGAEILLRRTNGFSEFDQVIKEVAGLRRPIEMLVLIAHSDVDGVEHGPREAMSWATAADWLRPLAPQKIFAIGCRTGSLIALKPLFMGLPSLLHVWGPPLKTNQLELGCITDRIRDAFHGIEIQEEPLRILSQAAAFAQRGEVVRHWRRDEVLNATTGDVVRWAFWDVLLEAVKEVHRTRRA